MNESKNESAAARWVGFRPEVKVVDCTIRDGGLMNNHKFDDKLIKAVYTANQMAGIDYMEIGYKSSDKIFSTDEHGKWKFCSEDDLNKVCEGGDGSLKLSVMADAGRTDYKNDILPCNESPIDLIRVACYIHQIPTALEIIKDAHDKGYETSVNIMAVSTAANCALEEALDIIADSETNIVYLVDSFGSFYGESTRVLIKKYISHMRDTGKTVGVHTHNNQQLAFANTVEAVIAGANMLDASMAGLGRGAGNCPVELLLSFLHNPKYNIRPILECIQDYIEPLRNDLMWGFDIPYMITGVLNQHPRDAMAFNAGEKRGKIVDFYDQITKDN